MQADWEVEIGPEAPAIDASWPGFIDLRRDLAQVAEIEETQKFPALTEALLQLNNPGPDCDAAGAAPRLPVWTAKCDLWVLEPGMEQWDPDEMDAIHAESAAGLACYIDLLPWMGLVFAGLDEAEAWARAIVSRLKEAACRCCRADLVIRRAFNRDAEGLGVTAYISACGADSDGAKEALSAALLSVVDAIGATTCPAKKS